VHDDDEKQLVYQSPTGNELGQLRMNDVTTLGFDADAGVSGLSCRRGTPGHTSGLIKHSALRHWRRSSTLEAPDDAQASFE